MANKISNQALALMTYEELTELSQRVQNRIEFVRNKEKEEDWAIVVNAIKNYCAKHGSIVISWCNGIEEGRFDDKVVYTQAGLIDCE